MDEQDEKNLMEQDQMSKEDVAHNDGAIEGGKRRDLFLPISILVAAVMITGAIVFAVLYKGGAGNPLAGNNGGNGGGDNGAQNGNGGNGGNGGAAATSTDPMTLGPRDAILGNANAKVTIVEYGDYQCPFCAKFFAETEPQIIQNYVNTGKARFVFRDFAFLGPESTAAAQAAQCAEDQNKLWAYHDALYAAKESDFKHGGNEDDGFYSRAEFLKLAQQVGLNIPTFTSCIDNNTDASIVANERAAAAAAGVNSTPSFFINGQQVTGAEPYSVFQPILDAASK